ncbi:hypothetical protein IPV09_02765 [Tessaracoccus sp. SD287]|uniref:hypothetical protein n=1 Tax=Tessaracoccus sp. SD287 TaxID=2782008 RepID=UPI001A9791D5|nr:hypothetical protein [Tessaracoccus sp. SD287]MBO1030255.1 hypothetical protein [Tessaracoccus sp. SD287]
MTHHTPQQDQAHRHDGSFPDERGGTTSWGAPDAGPRPEALGTQHASHTGHKWWVHLLMCAPMLAIVVYLMATGAAGGGVILYALGCMVMMAVMMLFMNHSGRAGHGH